MSTEFLSKIKENCHLILGDSCCVQGGSHYSLHVVLWFVVLSNLDQAVWVWPLVAGNIVFSHSTFFHPDVSIQAGTAKFNAGGNLAMDYM